MTEYTYVSNLIPGETTNQLVLRGGDLILPMGQHADLTGDEVTRLSPRYQLVLGTSGDPSSPFKTVTRLVDLQDIDLSEVAASETKAVMITNTDGDRTVQLIDAGSITADARTDLRAVSTAATAADGDVMEVNAVSGNVVITLPSPTINRRVSVKKTDSSSHFVSIVVSGGAMIDGDSSVVLNNQWASVTFIADGSKWIDMNRQTIERAAGTDFSGLDDGDSAIIVYTNTAGRITGVPSLPATAPVLVHTGHIVLAAYNAVDEGYLLCDGSSYLNSAYPDLFAKIGTSYGSLDGSHFGVPDLLGRFPVGAGNSHEHGSTLIPFADHGGEATHQLSASQIPPHTHPAPSGASQGMYVRTAGSPSLWIPTATTSSGFPSPLFATPALTNASTGASTGGGGDHNNMPPYVGVNYFIKT